MEIAKLNPDVSLVQQHSFLRNAARKKNARELWYVWDPEETLSTVIQVLEVELRQAFDAADAPDGQDDDLQLSSGSLEGIDADTIWLAVWPVGGSRGRSVEGGDARLQSTIEPAAKRKIDYVTDELEGATAKRQRTSEEEEARQSLAQSSLSEEHTSTHRSVDSSSSNPSVPESEPESEPDSEPEPEPDSSSSEKSPAPSTKPVETRITLHNIMKRSASEPSDFEQPEFVLANSPNPPGSRKQPKSPPLPSWLSTGLKALRRQYPMDRFAGVMTYIALDRSTRNRVAFPPKGIPAPNTMTFAFLPGIKCDDCRITFTSAGPGRSIKNFEDHVESHSHREAVKKRCGS
ncbi:transcription regulatory protein SNF5 [Phlyctema vagabunda]|uniref:Transcription regulatory protein SNF5 n=1 Tax=Phlyctema vagabunda TaxID=108571 RepID=A0ABR4PKL1_9HELO